MDADYQRRAVGRRHRPNYGTPRANGVVAAGAGPQPEDPVIYDTIQNGDREERVVNQEATLAAREKQKQIKERFRAWVFADPDRTERLVRHLQRHLQQPAAAAVRRLASRLPRHEPDDHAATRTRRTPSGAA